MSTQPYRLDHGGLIDRNRPIRFTFNGRAYSGFDGDTLASALLANGIRLIARSFKYHRPRGIYATGAAEPNALVQLESGAYAEPNLRADQIQLYDGLAAFSQNAWPSPVFDLGGINQVFSRLLPAGFYYKTFMWPRRAWPRYERRIRRAAGMGRAPEQPDPDRYEHRHWHGDVLVVGGGPAGLAAALAAGRSGARVMLAHAGARFGGGLLAQTDSVNGESPHVWVDARVRELAALDNVFLLPHTNVAGYHGSNVLTVVEKLAEGRSAEAGVPRQRLWKVRAREVVLATGAIERPLVFADNDRPGVMLASAARRYAAQFAAAPGRRVVIATNNDSAYNAALDLHRAGVEVTAVVDARASAGGPLQARMREAGIECIYGTAPARTRGHRAVTGLDVATLGDDGHWRGDVRRLRCDTVCVSGGWNPTVHLFSQSQGSIRFDEGLATFLPDEPAQATTCAGAINRHPSVATAVREGWQTGANAARRVGHEPPAMGDALNVQSADAEDLAVQPLWAVPEPPRGHGKRFVDLQNDVTVDDVRLAVRENYSSVEHLKRYTTLGMGTDQGRTSNVNGLAILAGLLDTDIPSVGMTTFRPPYTPVTLGTVAGERRGQNYQPLRRTPLDACHTTAGAVFVNVGIWRRPRVYPQSGEAQDEATHREVANVRRNAGIVDVSTLGRIEVQGADAAEFLDSVYANRVSRLRVGHIRYSIMLRDDGAVFDDGTVTRLAPDHFHVTTTTAHAGEAMAHLIGHRQRHAPERQVFFTPATEHWAVVALAGPRAREVLQALHPDCDVHNEALPFMRVRDTHLGNELPARLFRASYSGELAFEIAVPASRGPELWQRLLSEGAPFGLMPYGTEAMSVLRIEKGHCVIGAEIDGRTGPDDLGLARMLQRDTDFIGKQALAMACWQTPERKQLVGLATASDDGPIPVGAQLVADADHALPNPILGHVTSACFSPELGHHIALALLSGGRKRVDERLYAMAPLTDVVREVRVQKPVFIDPDGQRLRA
jgi:sarcosine oxidase subunit alpha